MTAIAATGCSSAASPAAGESSTSAVTDIEVTAARDQNTSSGNETGDCWIYTANAWVESLELAAQKTVSPDAATPKHLSVAYVDYWDWYAQITTGVTNTGTKMDPAGLDGGGEWGDVADIMLARGVVQVTDFVSGKETSTSEANLVYAAAATMATSLKSGALKTTAARANGATVRAELDRAFKLSTTVRGWMTATFGADGATTFSNGGYASAPIRSTVDVQVLAPHPDGTSEVIALTDALGTKVGALNADGSPDPNVRSGDHAWSDAPFTLGSDDDNRAYFLRVQSALDAGVALPFGWYWADNADPKGVGQFEGAPTGTTNTDDSTGHYALAVDYTLSPDSSVDFFRLKDSEPYVHNVAGTGYSEVYLTYLLASDRVYDKPTKTWSTEPTMMENVILPPGF